MFALLRHGFVSLRRTPLLAVTIVGTLGLALGAAVVVFSFVHSFLFQPLPHVEASRLAVVYEYSLNGGRENATRVTAGTANDLFQRATAFSRTGIFRNESVTVHAGDATEVAFVQRVTANIFPMMGARAALGGVISPANFEVGGLHAAVLSDALWRRRFGADPAIIGRVIRLDQLDYQVVGVMPADFVVPTGDNNPQAWLSLFPTDYPRDDRLQRRHHFWAELKPGRSLAAAAGELDAIAAALRREHPAENGDRGLQLRSLRVDLLGDFGRQLVLLQGAVLLVLAVACFNCLCLLIARALERQREFAVRLALGAARRHLLAQLFAESLWLALPAAALAVGLAAAALPFGAALMPAGPAIQALPAPTLDLAVLAAACGAAILVAMLFSAVPLAQTRRLNLESVLRTGGRAGAAVRGVRAARWLASAQIALALALLISAALLLRSERNLATRPVGLPADQLDEFRVGLRGTTYADQARRLRFVDRLLDNLRALPGVRDAAAANFVLTQPPAGYAGFVQEGDGLQLTETPKQALQCLVTPNLFSTLDLRLVEGRWLTADDVAGHPTVAVINAALAAKYWPGQSAIGHRVRLEGPHADWVEIVGVASDIDGVGNQPRAIDAFYLPMAQWTPPGLGILFLVRHHGVAPDERALQRAVWAVDPDMQFFAHGTVAREYAGSTWQTRFVGNLVALFALLAVALALAGIYAVNSFFVARRTSEFGLRLALGATTGNILQLVLGDSLRLTAIGLLAGALLALATTQVLAGLLYAVPPVDLLVYATAAAAMVAACLAATFFPARRATKADPLLALRAE